MPYGQAVDKLLQQGIEETLLCTFHLLIKIHNLEQTSGKDRALALARDIIKKKVITEVKSTSLLSKKNKAEVKKRKQAEEFIGILGSAVINEEKYEFMDELLEVTLVCSEAEKRHVRHMGVHIAMILLISLGKQCKNKSSFIEELSQNSQKTAKERKKEAKEQVKYIKKALTKLKKQVIIARTIDVMTEIRVLIADSLLKMQAEGTLYLIIDKSIARVMAQFLHDKNKTVKKRALSIAVQILKLFDESKETERFIENAKEFINEMYDETHVTRIIQMGYNDVAVVGVKAVQALGAMYKRSMLDDVSIDFTCRLVLRKIPQVAQEAAKFIVQTYGQSKILTLEYELKDNTTIFSYDEIGSHKSIEELTSILGRAINSLDTHYHHKAICDGLEALEKETVTVFDIRSLSELLSRGEKEQQAESRANEIQLEVACHMFNWAAKRIDSLRNDESADSDWKKFKNALVGQIDYLILSNVNRLLPLLKHTDKVRYIIKAITFVNMEMVRSNGINLQLLKKIIETLCSIFPTTHSEKVAKAVNKVLKRIEKEADIEPDLTIRIEEMQGKLLENVRDILREEGGIKKKSSSIMKLPIITASCSLNRILSIKSIILPLLTDTNLQCSSLDKDCSEENVLYIIKALLMSYVNAFMILCIKPSTEIVNMEQLRQDIIAVHVACLKMHEDNLKLSGKVWVSLANLITISSNDGVREKNNDFYYEPDNMILAVMTEYLAYFIRAVYENDEDAIKECAEKEILTEINKAIQVLILSCEAVFHTELSVLYLAIFGSNKNSLVSEGMGQFLYKLSKRCVSFKGRSMYYVYVKEVIVTCYNYDFQYAEVHSEELLKRIKQENRNIDYKRFYSLLRAKEFMNMVLAECHFFVMVTENLEDDAEEQEKAKTKMELYNNFIVDLLKESLKASINFPLLEIVQKGILVEVFGWEKLNWLLQLFDALSQHVLKVDNNMKEEDKVILKEFRNELLQRISSKRIKRTPLGKAIPKHIPSLSVTGKRVETVQLNEIKESEGDEESGKKEETAQKRERSISITGKRKSTRKRLEF